ncbi:MAG: hypothetical protein ACFFD7_03000 [Candidatus Thorarchaeota archaeon]
MDISKFNKELKTKVALALSYEKRNEIESSIRLWLEISEMALNYSKSRGIDPSFKNMLINRIKGIIAHVKKLKAGQAEEFLFEEEEYIPETPLEEGIKEELIIKEITAESKDSLGSVRPSETTVSRESTIEKESNFKNIPEGFKEIQTSKDFKIITPHDDDFIKKRSSQETNPTQAHKPLPEDKRFEFEPSEDSEYLICFACGYDKNAKNAKVCKSCGTTLN